MISRLISNKYPTIADLGGKTGQLRRLVDPNDKLWSAFNPSIAYSPEHGYAMTIRSSNYVIQESTGALEMTTGGFVRNSVWFCELDQEELNIKTLTKVKFRLEDPSVIRGVEDAKLFWRDGSWYFTAVMLEKEHTLLARMSLYKYDHKTNVATFIKKWDGPNVFRPEKNWMMPYEPNENFDFIYGPSAIIKDDTLINKFTTNKNLGGLRGNTNLWELEDGNYLGVMHTTYMKTGTFFNSKTYGTQISNQKRYTHQIVKFNRFGDMIEITPEFIFDSLGIEFAMGIVEKDGYYVISYGSKDLSSHLAIIKSDIVHNLLKPVDTVKVPISDYTPI